MNDNGTCPICHKLVGYVEGRLAAHGGCQGNNLTCEEVAALEQTVLAMGGTIVRHLTIRASSVAVRISKDNLIDLYKEDT